MGENKKVVLGVDIGGTYTKLGLADRKGKLYYEDSVPTDQFENPQDLVNTIHKQVHSFISGDANEYNLIGIGVGAPNGNFYTGNIEFAPNLLWKGVVPLASIINDTFNLPTQLTNDANAAAIGEMIFGAAQNMENFLMITLGTGLGSGLVVNGSQVYGHDGFAGELGHVCAVEGGRMCGCGKRGCLETYVSATGIKRTVFELLATETTETVFRAIPFNDLESKQISEAAEAGDPIAKKAFKITGKMLGKALADTVAHISPQAIFLFGGLALAGDWIFEPAKKSMEENLLEIFRGKIKILPSALLHKNIAVLGAAALAWKNIEQD